MKPVALLLALLSTGAAAQERPSTMPTRDVDVTYRSDQAGHALEQRFRFTAATQRTRLDTPTPGLYAIVDYRARTMALVSDRDRGVVDMRAPPGGPGGVGAGISYVRRGVEQVAGLPCTEWETTDTHGQPATACFTADGVMLRARRGTQVVAVASRVAYGPIDPSVFTVPPSYSHATRRGP